MARGCRAAAEALSQVQVEFLHGMTREINENVDALMDGEFMLNEFVDRFIRVHRNALVSRSAIAGFERVESVGSGDAVGAPHWVVTLRNVPERLPVTRRQSPTVKEAMRS